MGKAITLQKNTEQQFRIFIESAPIAVGISRYGRTVYANAKYLGIFGFNGLDEVYGRPVTDRIVPQSRQQITEWIQRITAGLPGSREMEVEGFRKDGSHFPLYLSVTHIELDDGPADLGFFIDITERTRVAKALRESEGMFKALMDGSPVPILLADKQGKVEYVNEKFRERCGHSIEEIPTIEQWFLRVLPDPVNRVSAIAAWNAALRLVGQQGSEIHPQEFSVTCKDGTIHTFIPALSIVNEKTLAIFNDITGIKLAEESRLASETKYRRLYDSMMDAFVSVDMDGRIREFNEAYRGMLGYTSEELLKLTYVDITTDKWHAVESRIVKEQVLVRGYSDMYEKEYRKKDGTVFSVELRTFLLRDDNGKAVAMWAIVRDISGRKKYEEALEASYAKLQLVLGGVINAITMIVEIRDPYTAGHQKRVSRLAVAIAGELGLSGETIENIRIAATLHDIGKIYVPAEILSKPGTLTAIETNIVKVHPRASYDILKKIELPRSIALVALEHQERFDGSGYPRGLKGNEIIMEARVVAVADTLEAMMFRRPYREAASLEDALHEIEIQKGILYDPEVADAVQRLFRDKRFTFETGT